MPATAEIVSLAYQIRLTSSRAGEQPGGVSRAGEQPGGVSRQDQRKTRAMHASLYAGENDIWGKTEHLQGFATYSCRSLDILP